MRDTYSVGERAMEARANVGKGLGGCRRMCFGGRHYGASVAIQVQS